MKQAVIIVSREQLDNIPSGFVRAVNGKQYSIHSVQSAAFAPNGQEVVLVITIG